MPYISDSQNPNAPVISEPLAQLQSSQTQMAQIIQTTIETNPLHDRLNRLLSDTQRSDYAAIAQAINRDYTFPIRDYHELQSVINNTGQLPVKLFSNTKGLDSLVKAQTNDQTGFAAKVLVNRDGQLLIAFKGSDIKSLKDMQNNWSIMNGSVPKQVYDALHLYKLTLNFAKQNKLPNPVVIGHSLGGFLAQTIPAELAVSFSAPGAQQVVNRLIMDGHYSATGLPEQAQKTINLGSTRDPIFTMVGPDKNLSGKLEYPTSPHVTGSNGGTFYLQGKNISGFLGLNNHWNFWWELATSDLIVSDKDTTEYYEKAIADIKKQLGWLIFAPFTPSKTLSP